jgi:hypothetical protein
MTMPARNRWTFPLLAVLAAGPALCAEVATDDGLALRFADGGDVQALLIEGQPLPVSARPGGFRIAEVTPGGEELVTNPSLEEDADGDGIPDGFISGGVWRRDNTVARTGSWSMKADVPGPEDANSGSFGVIVPVEGGGTYLASFWLRSERRAGGHPSSGGYLQQQDAQGERTTTVFQQMMHGGVTGDSDWKQVSLMVTTEGDTRRLFIRTDIYFGTGTLWADDFSIQRIGGPGQPFPTTATPAEDGLRLRGARDGLEIEATLRPVGAMLRLEGTIRSTRPGDRCITLTWALPLNAEGGRWGNDVGVSKPLEAGGIYSNTAPLGRYGPYSIYPFSSVTTADGAAGVALAVPMNPPRPFRLGYDVEGGLSVSWDFGLSDLPELYPRSADFAAVVYRHEPEWGFRAAAARYYELFPEYFAVRVPKFGNWYYADLSTLERPEDFGLAFNEYLQPGSVAADHTQGNLVFGYTEPWGWWGWALGLRPAEEDPQPSYDEMMAILHERAADEEQLAQPGQNPAKVAQTILNSGVWDAEGRYTFGGNYVARWGGYNWVLNPSPYAVPEGLLSRFDGTYEWEIEPKLAMGADGIYLDSIVGSWTAVPNYRPEHLQRPRHPLTFSALEARPVQLGLWSNYELAAYVSEDLHGRGKLLMANIFPWHWVFFNHRLDVMGHETWGADDLTKMRAERTLAYHKPYCWLMQQGEESGTPEDRERWMQAAMLYAIAPNIVGGAKEPERYERWRELYRTYMPTIIALAEAGWEPVTYAQAEPAVLLERYGPADAGAFLAAHNEAAEPVATTITVEWARLGIAPPATVTRLPAGRAIALIGGRIKDTIGAGETCVYRLR